MASEDLDLAWGPGPTYLPGLPGLASSGWRDGVESAGSGRSRTAAGRRGHAACAVAPGAPGDIVIHQGDSWGWRWEGTCYIGHRVR